MQRGLARAVGFREDFLEEAEAINLDSEGPLASDSGGGILGRSNRMPKKQSYHKQTVCIKSRYFVGRKTRHRFEESSRGPEHVEFNQEVMVAYWKSLSGQMS